MTQVIRFAKSGARNAPTLPVDAITRTFGIFGVKDSGKTTTARVLVEGICKAGGNVVVLDPVGVWWGATRAGDGPGIPGIVVGGEQGDVPLEKTGGQLVAELCVARSYPLVVVDLKLLRKGEAQHFMADFLEGVYFANRRPLMLVFEEADRALPQNPRGMDPTLGRVMGAAEDIVKLGRSRGLGSTFISQRFATVTKNVTEQIEALLLHRQIGPNDRKAVKAWIESNGDPTTTATVLDSMASLEQGEAWLYSPGWLRMLERVRMRYPRTLDSSATPSNELAEEQASAKRAPVNLDELRERMAETVERAAANDPKTLKARIAELEAEVERVREERPPAEPVEPVRIVVPDREALAEMVQVPAAVQAALDELDVLTSDVERVAGDAVRGMKEAAAALEEARERALAGYEAVAALPAGGTVPPSPASRSVPEHPPARVQRSTPAASTSNGGGPEQRILDALAWLAMVGIEPAQRVQVAMVAGYHPRTGSFLTGLATLQEGGSVFYPQPGFVELTVAGRDIAHAPDVPPTDEALQAMIYAQVKDVPERVLREVVGVFPDSITRAELAERLGFHPRTGSYLQAIGALKKLGLVHFPRSGWVQATGLLFPTRR